MKSLLLISACALAVVSTLAQGTVNFANRVTTGATPINVPVFDTDGATKLLGDGYAAQLYAGANESSLAAVTPATTFYPSTTPAAAGYWKPVGVTVPGTTTGGNAVAQVYVWESKYGSFAEAKAQGGKFGQSAVFTISKLGGPDPAGGPPVLPAVMGGLQSFSVQVIPEPSTIALGFLGAAALMFRRRK